MTHAGVIADDSFDHIELRLCGAYDKQNPRTEIEVLSISGDKNRAVQRQFSELQTL